MLEFVQSLGLFGYVVIAIVVLALLNIRKLIWLNSPLDSQEHKNWKRTGAITPPDHLEPKAPERDL